MRAPLILLLAAIPLFAVNLYNELGIRAVREAELHDEARRWLINIEDEQRHVFGEASRMLDTLIDTGTVTLDPARCAEVMARLSDRYPHYLMVTVTDADGIVRCATEPAAVGHSVADRATFRQALEMRDLIQGLATLSRYSGRPMIPLVKWYEVDGRFGGVVTVLIDAGWLEQLLNRKPRPPHTAMLIADREGTVFARVPQTGGGLSPLPASFRPLLDAPENGVAELRGDDGKPLIAAYSPVDAGVNATFAAVSIDREARMAAINRATLRSLLVSAAVLLGAVLAAGWALRRHLRYRERAEAQLTAAKQRAEQAVAVQRRQLQELESIYAYAPVGLWLGDRDCRFLRVNEVMAEINGLPVEAQIGRTVKELVPGVYDFIKPYYDRVLDTGRPVEFEVTGTTPKQPDAIREWVVAYYPLIDEAGTVYAVSSVVHEVTEERRAKRALTAAKQEAETASQAKSRFLAAASHDLRQPMQSLFLFAAVLHRHLDPAGREKLVQLERSLEALKGLLDSLLDISKLDAGLVKAAIEDFPLSAVFDELDAAYRPVAEGRGLGWGMQGCQVEVRSDRILLGRLMRNLIENALRYTEAGHIAVRCVPAADHVRIEVEDTGIGIPSEQRERIFEEFHQIANVERNRQQGLGLGLAIVRRIAELLDCRIELRSEVGRGSVFAFSVPRGVAAPAPVPAPAAEPAAPAGAERLALIIDDEVLVLLGLQAMLKEWGCTVLIATSADQAVERLRASGARPDFILADYRLGQGKLGTEAVAQIRAFCGREIPGVLLTGETGAESLREAAANGLRILHKPVTPKHLAEALNMPPEEPARRTG